MLTTVNRRMSSNNQIKLHFLLECMHCGAESQLAKILPKQQANQMDFPRDFYYFLRYWK